MSLNEAINKAFDAPLGNENKKKENSIKPYSRVERINRVLKNSKEFDLASYEADGGDSWIDDRRKDFFTKDEAKDKALWDRCSGEADSWQMTVWLYTKLGGKFGE